MSLPGQDLPLTLSTCVTFPAKLGMERENKAAIIQEKFHEYSHAEDSMQPCCSSTDIKLKSNHLNLYCTGQMPESVSCSQLDSHQIKYGYTRYLHSTHWIQYKQIYGAMWIHVLQV